MGGAPATARKFLRWECVCPCHRVRHLGTPSRDCLYIATPPAAGDVHVAVMLRTDVFRAERPRAKKKKPSLVEVFDIVNEVVASRLSARPLGFPEFASCLEEQLRLA